MRRFAPAVATLFALAAPLAAAPATKTVEHTIPAQGQVKVANLAGRVVLVPAANGPVKIVAVVNAEGKSAQETRDLMQAMRWVQEPDGTWNLAYPVDRYGAFVYPDGLGSFGRHTNMKFRGRRVDVYGRPRHEAPVLYADLTVSVPKGARLKVANAVGGMRGQALEGDLYLDTNSGDIKVDGVVGAITADTGSGNVELSHVAGNAVADTGSGDVVIDDIAGESLKVDTGSGNVTVSHATVRDLGADTGSGDVNLDHVKLETLIADTGSGEVTVSGDLADARSIDIDTGSGDVEVLGGPGFEFDLVTDTGSGDVSVGYADAELRRNRHDVVGARRGSGQTRVLVDTGSGDVRIAPSRSG
jgi:hypothetical protein